MPIFEDEAIVLRQYPIADSDVIVVSLGPEIGKFRAVAQGLKKTKSRFAGCLEPLNHIRVTLYSREGRDLGRIRNADLIHSYSGKIRSLDHIFAMTYFAELALAVSEDNHPNPVLFRLLLASLKAGERRVSVLPLLRYFEIWCLKINGLYPNYDYCSDCGKYVKDVGFFARIYEGLALCTNCSGKTDLRIGAEASRALQEMMVLSPEDFSARPLDTESCRQIERLAQGLLGLHLDSPLKSYKILKDALN